MPPFHVLRVFTNAHGEWGNPLAVFLHGAGLPGPARQQVAADLGFSETVFVEDRAQGLLRIHTPTLELPFAGHPSVGTAWLLSRTGTPPSSLRLPAGVVEVRADDDATYVSARPEWAPEFELRQLTSPAEVDELQPSPSSGNVYAWAWIDEASGAIRARSFVPEAGIPEDEATGSAAIVLCAQLGKPLTIHQGAGSVLRTQPQDDGWVEVGGAVALGGSRSYSR